MAPRSDVLGSSDVGRASFFSTEALGKVGHRRVFGASECQTVGLAAATFFCPFLCKLSPPEPRIAQTAPSRAAVEVKLGREELEKERGIEFRV